MKIRKQLIFIGILLLFSFLIHLFSASRLRVEQYFSSDFYIVISKILRFLFGWIPFSIGDILYGLVFLWLIAKVIKAIKAVVAKKFHYKDILPVLLSGLGKLLIVYILFNFFWGINYNRIGIAGQLNLSVEKYSIPELKNLNQILLQKVNISNQLLLEKPMVLMSSKDLFQKSNNAYQEVNKRYAFLQYFPSSIKTSMWGWLGNYISFSGYYNPFTGESQVNTNIPNFLQPYTNCHEIAHQLGYAKESEANFVGYLAATASKDESFHYSAYLDLFLYANNNLFATDSAAARSYAKQLSPAIKTDLKAWRMFSMQHKNPVEPLVRWIYGKFLENNQQPSGLLSYDEVTGFMIAYYKKFGSL